MTAQNDVKIGLGNEGVRIVLFRVNVGHEGDVVNLLKKHLEKDKNSINPNTIDFKIYKVLGLYDIMLIIRCRNFSQELLKKGTFDHVIHANEILCFTFSGGQAAASPRFDFPKEGIFITLLKLTLEPLLTFGKDLQDAVALYMEKVTNVQVLGCLGWNELLTVYSHSFKKEHMEYIFSNYMFQASALGLQHQKEMKPLVHKIYSFMGVSYDVMDRLEKTFPHSFGADKKEACPRLHISVTAENLGRLYEEIPRFFPSFKYDNPRVMMGIYDISIPFKKGVWGKFIDSVMKFRKKNADSILDTRIELSAHVIPENTGSFKNKHRKPRGDFPKIQLPEENTVSILSRAGTSHIISTIYCFNHYVQNALLQDSFLDLYIPARKLLNEVVSRETVNKWMLGKKKLSQLLAEFQWAMRERAMGAYLFTEEDEHSFSPIKGGLQKILLALESIPFSLLTKLIQRREFPWQGFVSIGLKDEPVHFMENIHVPFDHILYPERFWWCIIHETAHILTMLWKVLDKKHPVVHEVFDRLPIQKNLNIEAFRNMADNCFADTFDFIVGFLGNRRLYIDHCWNFLLDNAEGEDDAREYMMRHFIRHFFGWLFEGRFLTKRLKNWRLDDSKLAEKEAQAFVQSLEEVSRLKDKLSANFPEKSEFLKELIHQSAPYMRLLDHFNKFLVPAMALSQELKQEYHSKKFQNNISLLVREGRVIPHYDIQYPHLIPLKLMENRVRTDFQLSFQARIAVILSLFWYSHHHFLPEIFSAYKRAQRTQTH